MAHILFVDDEEDIRRLVQRVLERGGHQVDLAADGEQAIRHVESQEYDLVMTDVRMPRLDGLEFLRCIRHRIEAKTPCIIVTAFEEAQYAIEATRLGVRDFLVKPFPIRELEQVVGKVLEIREDWRYRRERESWLERERLKLEKEVHDTLLAVLSAFGEQLESTAHAKDHCRRVATATVDLARAVGLTDEVHLNTVRMGAILHDIGKLRVAPEIWKKGPDDPLTEEDWVQIRKHPELGAEIIERVERLAPAATIIRYHHEKYDGTGYPDGLVGAEIPLEARIFSIIDAYDCMVDEHRSYKKPRTPHEALAELRRCTPSQFDPDLVDLFAECVFPRLEREWVENGGRVPVNGEVDMEFHTLLPAPDRMPSWLRGVG